MRHMNEFRILLANSPRSYRDTFAAVFRSQHPWARVMAVEPHELVHHIGAFSPHLIICSELTPEVAAHQGHWLVLDPERQRQATLGHPSGSRILTNVDLSLLLALIAEIGLSFLA